MRMKKMKTIKINFEANVDEILGLYDNETFSEKKAKELLSQFTKEDLIDSLLLANSSNDDEIDSEESDEETDEEIEKKEIEDNNNKVVEEETDQESDEETESESNDDNDEDDYIL